MASNTQTTDNEAIVKENGQELKEQKQTQENHIESNTNEEGDESGIKKWRAKLYQLNNDGGWDDLGTGNCHVDTKK